MIGKYGTWLAGVAGAVIVSSGCGNGNGAANCATSDAARACVVRASGGAHFELTGFRPNSEIAVTRDGPPNPGVADSQPGGQPGPTEPDQTMTFRVTADGTNGGGVLGIVGIAGPVTFTLSGTAATGNPVVLSLVVGG
ncbi:MAG: hypothetical protein QOG43_2330 [Actinomycetota bacterium]|jgi:hypothetical protein|nr:hypothetical protein [Actinomycetota bacterium]